MAKASQIDRVVAEMNVEKRIVDMCIALQEKAAQPYTPLEAHSETLAACIARLTSNGSEPTAPKPTHTRKGRKATEPSI